MVSAGYLKYEPARSVRLTAQQGMQAQDEALLLLHQPTEGASIKLPVVPEFDVGH